MKKPDPSAHALDTDFWIHYFHRNQLNRKEPAWSAELNIPDEVLPLLRQSIREFQLGDGGGPAGLIAFNAASFRDATPAIRRVVDLWFEEEKEHSRLLGDLVKRLGTSPVNSHWSFFLFCFFRRVLGVKFELQILTVTELVSTSYYTLLRRYGSDVALRGVCALILRDEAGHVRFQNARLAAAGRSRRGILGKLWAAQFWLSGYIAGTVLWISHGKCIRTMGGSTREFYIHVRQQIGGFMEKLDRKAVTGTQVIGPMQATPTVREK